MKQILAFLALLSHLNFMMFTPHLDEVDIYNAKGKQVHDINAVTDLLSDLLLDTPPDAQGDQDDDNAIYVHTGKAADYLSEHLTLPVGSPLFSVALRLAYKPYAESGHVQPLLVTPSPPPDPAT